MLLVATTVGCSANKEASEVQNGSQQEETTDSKQTETGGEQSIYTEIGTYPIVNEKITLKFFAPETPVIIDLNTNEFTKYMEDKTNIHIEWETAPMDSVNEKINLILASGDYPDVFFGCDIRTDVEERYGTQEGIFIPLDDLIDKYTVNFKQILQEREELNDVIRATDGKIYSLPSIQDCFHCEYAQKMWINKFWLDKLGLNMPQNTEEFYQVLKAFKEQDPNGNGKQDEVPLAGAIDGWHQGIDNYIMNAFIFDSGVEDPLRRFVKDGKVDTSVNKPEYREGLKYLNRLYKEGLIYEGSFTQKFDQVKQLALNAGDEILGAAPAGHLAMFLDVVTDPERYRHFTSLPPLEGPNGYRVATHFKYFAIQPGEFAITKSCEYPEAAIRYADAYYDYETQMYRQWGKEGEAWRKAESGELGLDGKPALYKVLVPFDENAQNIHYGWLGIEYIPNELWNGQNVVSADTDLYSAEGFEKLLYEETKQKYEPYKSSDTEVVPPLRFTREESERISILSVELENYIKDARVRFIMGDMDLDTEWESYVAGLESIGLSEYLDIVQKAYDRMHK